MFVNLVKSEMMMGDCALWLGYSNFGVKKHQSSQDSALTSRVSESDPSIVVGNDLSALFAVHRRLPPIEERKVSTLSASEGQLLTKCRRLCDSDSPHVRSVASSTYS
uniref:Uncharacterized protein n=1 Tax=Trichuris muris TaxID=70415 RepID=A0A5S6Q278_TRIMR